MNLRLNELPFGEIVAVTCVVEWIFNTRRAADRSDCVVARGAGMLIFVNVIASYDANGTNVDGLLEFGKPQRAKGGDL